MSMCISGLMQSLLGTRACDFVTFVRHFTLGDEEPHFKLWKFSSYGVQTQRSSQNMSSA